jgi:hypothetical protein
MNETTSKENETIEGTATEVIAAPAPAAPMLSEQESEWRLLERKALGLSKAQSAIPDAYRNKPGDILAAWMMGDELGIGRMQALRSLYIVNGKPVMSGDILLALARAHGVKVTETSHVVITENDEAGEDIESDPSKSFARCEVTIKSGEVVTAEFSVADAIKAGLWNKPGPWQQYPARMMAMRARGFALRDACGDIFAGIYIEGELDAIDITPGDQR